MRLTSISHFSITEIFFPLKPEASSESCQTFKLEFFVQIVHGWNFRKKLHFRCLTGLWILFWNPNTYPAKPPIKNNTECTDNAGLPCQIRKKVKYLVCLTAQIIKIVASGLFFEGNIPIFFFFFFFIFLCVLLIVDYKVLRFNLIIWTYLNGILNPQASYPFRKVGKDGY